MCIDRKSVGGLNITGNSFTDVQKYFSISLNPCIRECASSNDINSYFARNPRLYVMYKETYLDINALPLFQTAVNRNNFIQIDP